MGRNGISTEVRGSVVDASRDTWIFLSRETNAVNLIAMDGENHNVNKICNSPNFVSS